MDKLTELLPFLIPLFLIQLALMITALMHVLKHPQYRFGSRTMWILVVVLLQIIGPVVYFAFGRGEE